MSSAPGTEIARLAVAKRAASPCPTHLAQCIRLGFAPKVDPSCGDCAEEEVLAVLAAMRPDARDEIVRLDGPWWRVGVETAEDESRALVVEIHERVIDLERANRTPDGMIPISLRDREDAERLARMISEAADVAWPQGLLS